MFKVHEHITDAVSLFWLVNFLPTVPSWYSAVCEEMHEKLGGTMAGAADPN